MSPLDAHNNGFGSPDGTGGSAELERLAELVLEGIDDDTAEQLSAKDEWLDFQRLEAAAAACELASGPGDFEAPPSRVREKLDRLADHWEQHGRASIPMAAFVGTSAQASEPISDPAAVDAPVAGGPQQRSALVWSGWAIAAAAALVAAIGWMGPSLSATAPGAVELRETLLASGAQSYEWSPWELGGEGPEFEGVTGSVVWDPDSERGVMRFAGLPKNDPSEWVYQLWIVDSRGLVNEETGQSERISGGVFSFGDAEYDAEAGVYLVPFEPRLEIRGGAAAFALTIEQPGGTWVSDMSRRVVIASAG